MRPRPVAAIDPGLLPSASLSGICHAIRPGTTATQCLAARRVSTAGDILDGDRNSSLSHLCHVDQLPRAKMPALQGSPTRCAANQSGFSETGGRRLRDDCRRAVVGSDSGSRVVRLFGDRVWRAGAGSVHPLVVGDAADPERVVTRVSLFSVVAVSFNNQNIYLAQSCIDF